MDSFQPFSAEPMPSFAHFSGKGRQPGRKGNYHRLTRNSCNFKLASEPPSVFSTVHRKKGENCPGDTDLDHTEQSTKDLNPYNSEPCKDSQKATRQSVEGQPHGLFNYSIPDRTNDSVHMSVSSRKVSERKDASESSNTPLQNRRIKLPPIKVISRPQSESSGGRDFRVATLNKTLYAMPRLPDPVAMTSTHTRLPSQTHIRNSHLRIKSSQQPSRVMRSESMRTTKNVIYVQESDSPNCNMPIPGVPMRVVFKGGAATNINRHESEMGLLEDQKNDILLKIQKVGSSKRSSFHITSEGKPLSKGSRRGESGCLSNCEVSVKESPELRPRALESPGMNYQLFDRLVKGNIVGEGSYGVVYTALDKTTGKVYAIKEMKTDCNNPHVRFCKSFENEIKILSGLDHKNVQKYYGYKKEGGQFKIVTDYMEEGSMKTILQEMGPFPVCLIKQYTRQLVAALGYIHNKGTVSSTRHCP